MAEEGLVSAQAQGQEWSAGCDSAGAPARRDHSRRDPGGAGSALGFYSGEMRCLGALEHRLPLSDGHSRTFLPAAAEPGMRRMKADVGTVVGRRLQAARREITGKKLEK